MRRGFIIAAVFLGLFAGWYAAWSWIVSDSITQIKATIAYHNQQLKSITPTMVLKAERVVGAGFPFRFGVKVEQLQLSMIDGTETYLVRLPEVKFHPADETGSYWLEIPNQWDALYAVDKGAPEHYTVMLREVPGLTLKAADKSTPLMQYHVALPPLITLEMVLNDQKRTANFPMPAVDFNAYYEIPNDVQRPLWLFVGVLREALVFGAPINTL